MGARNPPPLSACHPTLLLDDEHLAAGTCTRLWFPPSAARVHAARTTVMAAAAGSAARARTQHSIMARDNRGCR
jgi:hypothetical protein